MGNYIIPIELLSTVAATYTKLSTKSIKLWKSSNLFNQINLNENIWKPRATMFNSERKIVSESQFKLTCNTVWELLNLDWYSYS